jgi:hypothetical protein
LDAGGRPQTPPQGGVWSRRKKEKGRRQGCGGVFFQYGFWYRNATTRRDDPPMPPMVMCDDEGKNSVAKSV